MFHLVALLVVHSGKHLRGKMRSGRKYYSRDLTLNSDHITAANYDVMRVSGMEMVHLLWGGLYVNISPPPRRLHSSFCIYTFLMNFLLLCFLSGQEFVKKSCIENSKKK